MPLAYTAFTLLVFWQVWTPIAGAAGFWRFDPRFEYWGDLIFQSHTLRHGVVAMWNPFDRGGFPIYGDPQPGLLYPGNWPLIGWGVLTGSVGYGVVGVKILGHWVLAAAGMHLFLRRLGAREQACYAGGTLVAFTSPRMRYGGSALNWSVAWIPWLLLAAHWFAERPTWRRGVVLGTTFSMVLLAGAPAAVIYALLAAVPFGLYALRGRLRASWKPLAVAAGVAMLWILPLIASNLAQLPESVRQQRDLSFIAHSAYTPGHLIGFFAPRLSGQNIYFGILALLATGLMLASERRGLALLWCGVAAAGVMLAFGGHAGFLPATASAVPGFGFFRQAHRYVYVTAIAVPITAGLGLSYAMTIEDEERRRGLARALTLAGGAIAFALAVAWLVAIIVGKVDSDKSDALALGTVSAAAGTWLLRELLLRDGRWRTTVAWLAVAVVALDVWTANSSAVAVGFTPPPVPKHDAAVAQLSGVDRDWRVYDWGYLDFRPGTRLGIRDFGGYEDDPLGLSRYTLLRDAVRHDLRLLGHANVRYFLNGNNRQPRLHPRPADGFHQLQRGVWELDQRAPAVYWVPEAEVAANPRAALDALRRIEPGAGAVVEGPKPPVGPPGAAPAAGRLTRLEPNRAVAEIDTPGPGLVVIAEAYYPAWRATVDGKQVDIQPANVMFRGLPVDAAGHHRIVMTLRPMRFWGLLPAYLAAVILFAWAVISALRRRRRARLDRTSRPPTSARPTAEESA